MEEIVSQELELFFKNNYRKNIREFRMEFETNFPLKKTLDKVLYLLKLFKNEKKKIIKEIKEDENEILRLNNIDAIINYLETYTKIQKNKKVSKLKNSNKKTKKYRRENFVIVFTPKTLELVESFEKEYNYSKLSYEEVMDLIKYYYNKKINIITQNDTYKDSTLDIEIEKINNIFQELIRHKKKFLNNGKKAIKKPVSIIDEIDKPKVKKKNKNKKSISEEISRLIENGYEIEKLETNELIELTKYYNQEKRKMINLKKQYVNQHEKIEWVNQKIKEYKQLLKEISHENKKRNMFSKESPSEKRIQFTLPISTEQIEEIDETYGVDTISVIKNIQNKGIDDSSLELEKLYETYINCKKTVLRNKINLSSQRRKIKKYSKDRMSAVLQEINELLEKINIHMDILNNLINYLKYYQRNNSSKIKEDTLIFANEIEINDIQEIIEENLSKGLSIEYYELKDILYGLGHHIKYNGEIDKKLLETVNNVFKKCMNLTVKDEIELNAIYYIWDSIKYRLAHTPKDNNKERENLKEIRKLFDYVIENYKEDKKVFNHDYRFNIIDYLLKNEEDYLCIKKLVEKLPDFVNTRYIIEENGQKQAKHILFYILETFIDNYKTMLRDRKSEYINKDYLKSVYLLFIKNYRIYLTEEEKSQIDKILGDFVREVNIVLTSSKRSNAVKEDLKPMYTHKMYINTRRNILNDINENRLESQMNSMFMSINTSINRKRRTDLTNECTFLVGRGYHAYSICKKDDKTILKIHVIDLYDIFTRNSELEKYLYNKTLKKEELDIFILNQLDMVVAHTYPTITYEIEFDKKGNYKRKNGHIDKFSMYQSKIKPKIYYSDFDLKYSKGDVVLKSFLDLYRTSLIKNHGNYKSEYSLMDIKIYFENILKQGVIEYFRFNNLPFIYSGTKEKNKQESIRIMNNINHILSRISEEDFKVIYGVINNSADEFHYSLKEFEGEYNLSIQNPISSVGLLIQRFLHEMVFENKHNETEYEKALEDFEEEMNELVMYLNYYNNYIDVDILKQNKGNLKNAQKILI